MNAYISNDLNMVRELDPARHELALLQQEFLSHGGAIEVLAGPNFIPPPKRHEPPPRKRMPRHVQKQAPDTAYIDKITLRDIEREERVAQRMKDKAERIEHVRKLAETMTYAEAVLRTGIPRRTLQKMAVENGFKFRPAFNPGNSNVKARTVDEASDAKYAERIRAFMEIGLSRNQAMNQMNITFKTFARLLLKFNIDYPKHRAGPHPAFFPKHSKQE